MPLPNSPASSPPPGSESLSSSDNGDELSRLKRKVAALQADLINSERTRKKPATLTSQGRGICKIVSLFEDISTMIEEADRRDEEGDTVVDDDLSPDQLAISQRNHDRTYTAYKKLIQLIPSLKSKLTTCPPEEMAPFCSALMKGATDARGDDISDMKYSVAEWLNQSNALEATERLNAHDRTTRGLQHDVTGKLLCPIEFDWDDLDVRAKLREGLPGYDVSSSFYCRCLYSGNEGDPDNIEKGFLRSPLLLKTYLTIFHSRSLADGVNDNENIAPRSPSTRKKDKQSTKANIATRLKMDAVTPRAIAYAAVLLHFNMTDAYHWKIEYNGFNYEAFYNFIVDYMEDVPDSDLLGQSAAKDVLSWWNKMVFPNKIHARAQTVDSTMKLRKQREARMRQL